MINPHQIETVILDWLGVVTAVSVAVLGTVSLLWVRWKTTMKQLLDNHADEVGNNMMKKIDEKEKSDAEKVIANELSRQEAALKLKPDDKK